MTNYLNNQWISSFVIVCLDKCVKLSIDEGHKAVGITIEVSFLCTGWQTLQMALIFLLFFSVSTPSGVGGGYGPGGTWGLVELMAAIAGPLFLLCLLLLVGLFLYQYHHRAYNNRQRLEVEDPSCDNLYLAKDRTLQDLIYDLSTSGSGSG